MPLIRSLVFAACVGLTATSALAGASDTTPQGQLRVVPVERAQTRLTVSIAGTVTPFKTVQLTAQIPGRVKYIAGREGDDFAEGRVLIELDDSALLARREAAVAAREAAIASIRNAQAQYRRELYSPRSDATNMAPGGFGFPAMMDQMFGSPMEDAMGFRDRDAEQYSNVIDVQTRVAQAQTTLRQADASISEIDSRLRDTRSMTPFAGVIDKLYVEVGDTVQPGQPLIDFSQSGLYKVEADLPVHLARTLKPGMTLPVIFDKQGQRTLAQVYRIYPTADLQRHTIHVEFTLPQSTSATAGQYVELEVTDTGADIPAQLSIPRSAVIDKGGMPLVFSIDTNGVARLRVVRLGDELSGGRVAVLSGVRAGDRVIDSPPPGLKAGAVVQPPAETHAENANSTSEQDR